VGGNGIDTRCWLKSYLERPSNCDQRKRNTRMRVHLGKEKKEGKKAISSGTMSSEKVEKSGGKPQDIARKPGVSTKKGQAVIGPYTSG